MIVFCCRVFFLKVAFFPVFFLFHIRGFPRKSINFVNVVIFKNRVLKKLIGSCVYMAEIFLLQGDLAGPFCGEQL